MNGPTTPDEHGPTSGSWACIDIVAAAKQSLDQSLADAGFTPVVDEPAKPVRHLHLIQGGKS